MDHIPYDQAFQWCAWFCTGRESNGRSSSSSSGDMNRAHQMSWETQRAAVVRAAASKDSFSWSVNSEQTWKGQSGWAAVVLGMLRTWVIQVFRIKLAEWCQQQWLSKSELCMRSTLWSLKLSQDQRETESTLLSLFISDGSHVPVAISQWSIICSRYMISPYTMP